ncbi:MAG: oxygen-independent coproporphyrinogen III oxidase [Pseudomonas sp.]
MENLPFPHAALAWNFDPVLLRRYDRPGPRYTSYPTAPHFGTDFDGAQLQRAIIRSQSRQSRRALSLYVHVPYCTSPCFYCGCNRIVTRDRSKGEAYVRRVLREAELVAASVEPRREVMQLHLGGGTPNFLSPALIGKLVRGLGEHFRFDTSSSRDFSIELDPRHVTGEDIEALAMAGFNRTSLGIQDFDPDVQQAINRVQGVEETLGVIDACRRHGIRSVNVDLIYGLPRQNLDGFARTLDAVIHARPDRLAVYGYAHLPQLFRAQRRIAEAELLDAELKLALLGVAVRKLAEAGYQYIGMDHFALQGDELARAQRRGDLHRNFMGYTTHADSDLLGLGVSAISHVGDSYSQNPRELPQWEAAIDEGRLPTARGLALSQDDRLRADVIQRLMCLGEVDFAAIEAAHGIDFRDYFAAELEVLAPLQDDGLAVVEPGRVRATGQGRPLIRLIAMCFDRYLQSPQQPARYSKAI